MARVYMFNPQATPQPTPDFLRALVNNNLPAYEMDYAAQRFNFIPGSASGERTPDGQPQANLFGFNNSLLITGREQSLAYNFNIPQDQAPLTSDLILYIFRRALQLLNPQGVVLKTYSPINNEALAPEPEPIADSAMGRIYVFNVFSESTSLSINGIPASTIEGWSEGRSGEPPLFTPNVCPVDRSQNMQLGTFGNGVNTLIINRASQFAQFQLPINGTLYPITQSLLLYILFNRWFLATEFGAIVESGSIDVSAQGQDGLVDPAYGVLNKGDNHG